MKEEYNIDKLFREKLEGFSEVPPAFAWKGIQDQLALGRRKKRAAWYRWTAVAALVVFAFLAGWYFNETNDNSGAGFAETEMPVTNPAIPNDSAEAVTEPANDQRDEIPTEPVKNLLAGASDLKSSDAKKDLGTRKLEVTNSGNRHARQRLPVPARIQPVEASLNAHFMPDSEISQTASIAETGLSEAERETIRFNVSQYAARETAKTGWRMGLNVSPGYSSYSARHDVGYASNMTHEASEGNANLNGGVAVRYRTASRWSVESGVYYAQNGQQTGSSPQIFGGRTEADFASSPPEQLYFNTNVRMVNSHLAMNSTAGVIEIENLPAGAEIAANLENTFLNGNSLITQGELSQVFDFVEIPVYLRYLVVESKLDVELVGGVSAGMVVGNNAFLENQYGVQNIGKTQDISPVNFSGTFGIGLTYALGKQFSLAMEPRFNYYLNSISRNPDVDFRPYRIGVYTGLYYSF